MTKRRQSHRSRPKARVRADGTMASGPRRRPAETALAEAAKGKSRDTGAEAGAASASPPEKASVGEGAGATGTRPDFAAIFASSGFRRSLWLLGAGFVLLLLSQGLPHDYGFLELGALFTFSVYDLALAMLGLSLGVAMVETRREFGWIIGVFLGVLLVMLTLFDTIFGLILSSPLGEVLYLIAPAAVISTGLSLWLVGRPRRWAVMIAAGLVAFSYSLFVGLDDLGVGLVDFASGTVMSALWLVLAPGLMLRHFRGPWLVIPSRIVGSWLIVIGVIVLVSLYMPLPVNAPSLPDPSQPDGGAIELLVPEDGSAPMLNGEVLDLGEPSDPADPADPLPAPAEPGYDPAPGLAPMPETPPRP